MSSVDLAPTFFDRCAMVSGSRCGVFHQKLRLLNFQSSSLEYKIYSQNYEFFIKYILPQYQHYHFVMKVFTSGTPDHAALIVVRRLAQVTTLLMRQCL